MSTTLVKKEYSATNTNWLSVFALTLAAIVFVTAELLPIGILPEISVSLHQSIGKVGLIVTSYAWTVAISAVLITTGLAALERKILLFLILIVFAVANLLVACSPSLSYLFIARVISAFSHGVFWSTVGPLCVRLSGQTSKARVTAIVFGGIAIATVVAVPVGTLLSQWLGWRVAFIAIALTSFVIAIIIGFVFPRLSSDNHRALNSIPQLLRHPLMQRLCPATALALTGHFCALTYISPLLEKGIGISYHYLAFYLFLFGAAGFLGSGLAGMLGEHHLFRAAQYITITMGIVIIGLACLPIGANVSAACLIIIWGACICLLTVTLQSLIFTLPVHLRDAASALYVSMFNTGIGSGALLGGLFIDYLSPKGVAWIGGFILFMAAAILLKKSTKFV